MTMPAVILSGDVRYVLQREAVIEPNPQGWYRYQVLHDWQWNQEGNLRGWDHLSGLPEINRIGEKDDRTSHVKVALTSPMQFAWAELLSTHKFGRTLVALTVEERSMVNSWMDGVMSKSYALTNRTSDEPVANFVAGMNTNAEMARMAPLICGGNTVWGKPAGRNSKGVEMVQIHSFLKDQALPAVIELDDPRVNFVTVIYAEGEVYPQKLLGVGVGVPYPLITAKEYFYPAKGLTPYSFDEPKRLLYVRNGAPSYA